MQKITLTLDLNRETVNALGVLVDALERKTDNTAPVPEATAAPAKPKAKIVKKAEQKKEDAPGTEKPKIGLPEIRVVALKLSKAGRQAELKEFFAKYGAEKLSDVPEADYPALMEDLEGANV